jgi:hypothetical protein
MDRSDTESSSSSSSVKRIKFHFLLIFKYKSSHPTINLVQTLVDIFHQYHYLQWVFHRICFMLVEFYKLYYLIQLAGTDMLLCSRYHEICWGLKDNI